MIGGFLRAGAEGGPSATLMAGLDKWLFLVSYMYCTQTDLRVQTCAVCLEDFKVKDELGVLPCQHAFHRKCLVKWLEVRCVCPMCNKTIAGPPEQRNSIGTLLDELV
ncbi:unnamed protein product [Oncorhynchus mykiss]|uniref:RING-type domain-containing protein n=1 Tax=Oncorhynchus mykiss TaxID=8022 RepID=A0A060XR20_ONCMY|nr:unnamed protein product [Oncorhynchus mykiss]